MHGAARCPNPLSRRPRRGPATQGRGTERRYAPPPVSANLFCGGIGNAEVNATRRDDRTGIAAGSPIPIDLMKQLIEKLNLTELTVAYGMSA